MAVTPTSGLLPLDVFNSLLPKEHPKSLPILLDFRSVSLLTFDLQSAQSRAELSFAQTIWIDNAANSSPVSITFPFTNQTIEAAPNTQGYYPCSVVSPPKFTAISLGGVQIQIALYNVPIAGCVWSVINSSGGTGTVTSITANNGLTATPNPIIGAGTIGLAAIADGGMLSNISGAPAVPVSNNVSAILDYELGAVQGDIMYRNASGWVVLPPGTANFILQTGGAAANPSWVVAPTGLTAIADKRILSNISGGSALPIANTLSATIDSCIDNTQGDILYRSASGWVQLAPGTANQLLGTGGAAANPAWQNIASRLAAGAGIGITGTVTATIALSVPYLSVYLNTSQSVVSGAVTKVQFDTVEFDNKGWWDAVNFRYTPLLAGKYLVNGFVDCRATGATLTLGDCIIARNGTGVRSSTFTSAGATDETAVISGIMSCNGTTDFIELQGAVTATSPSFGGTASTYVLTSMAINYLGP